MASPKSRYTDEEIHARINRMISEGRKITLSSVAEELHVRRARLVPLLAEHRPSRNVQRSISLPKEAWAYFASIFSPQTSAEHGAEAILLRVYARRAEKKAQVSEKKAAAAATISAEGETVEISKYQLEIIMAMIRSLYVTWKKTWSESTTFGSKELWVLESAIAAEALYAALAPSDFRNSQKPITTALKGLSEEDQEKAEDFVQKFVVSE